MSNTVLTEMRDSPEFRKAWPLIWNKLEKFLLEEQRQFALEHRSKHSEIGQYVEFMAVLTDKLKSLDNVIQVEVTKAPSRPRLHNANLK